jgi:hypothetical protein
MIAKFQSEIPAGTSASPNGKSNMIITLAVIGLIAYLGYKYVYLPSKEKKPENDE